MSFLNGDEVLAGLKRGAEKFGSSTAIKAVKKFTLRLNGFTPNEPEPYGEGLGGANTEQDSTEVINEDSGNFGYQSAQKTTTAERSDLKNAFTPEQLETLEKLAQKLYGVSYRSLDKDLEKQDDLIRRVTGKYADKQNAEMQSKCLACGHESEEKWNGKCEGCGVKNALDMGSNERTKEDVVAENSDTAGNGKKEDVIEESEEYPHDAGKDGRKDVRKLEKSHEISNAGHLGPDAWERAATEERAVWLELASQDINLAVLKWSDLSLDVQVALQDSYDMPKSINNTSDEETCKGCGADLTKHDHSKNCELANAAGKPGKKKFIFKDVEGQEESVEAESLDKAWDMLANIFGESADSLKKIGVKFVRENSSEAGKCKSCGQGLSELDSNYGKCTNPKCQQSRENAEDPAGDVSEIERHVEGIEHELSEIKENADLNKFCKRCLSSVGGKPEGKKGVNANGTYHIVTREGPGHFEVACGDDVCCDPGTGEPERINAHPAGVENSGVSRGNFKYGSEKESK